VLFADHDTVSRYAYAADESTVVCSRGRGRGEGDWLASADGETVAYVARMNAYLYSVRDGRELGAHRIPGARSAWCLVPGGTLVVATWSKKIYTMRGEVRRELVRGVHADAVAIAPDGRRVAWASKTDGVALGWISL
jgi:hypothetical protein